MKTVAEDFENFMRHIRTPQMSDVQNDEMKKAFYAGFACAAFEELGGTLDSEARLFEISQFMQMLLTKN